MIMRAFLIGVQCGRDMLFEVIVEWHFDLILSLSTMLSALLVFAMSAFINIWTAPDVRKPKHKPSTSLPSRLCLLASHVLTEVIWWLAMPCTFCFYPFYVAWRIVIIVDRVCYALGVLLYGLTMIFWAGASHVITSSFDHVLTWLCWIYGVEHAIADDAFMMSSTTNESDWDARKYPSLARTTANTGSSSRTWHVTLEQLLPGSATTMHLSRRQCSGPTQAVTRLAHHLQEVPLQFGGGRNGCERSTHCSTAMSQSHAFVK